jgi:catecholate siderophore receptor
MHTAAFISLSLGALLLTVSPTTVTAQNPDGTSRATRVDTLLPRPFDIPSQPLVEALIAFQVQSGLRVMRDSTGLASVQSSSLAGLLSGSEALRQMLAGTGYTARFIDDSTAILRAATATPGPHALEPVRVVAARTARYGAAVTTSATKTPTPLRDVPQSVSIVTRDLMNDLSMQSMADVVRFVPGVTMGQGEGNRDQPTIRGNNTTADFFVDGVRDDVQYFRDLYNVERVEALKGSNAMIFGRGGGGGVLNRVTKQAEWSMLRELTLQGGSFDNKRASLDLGTGLSAGVAGRMNGMIERSGLFRDGVSVDRYGINPTLTLASSSRKTRVALGYELFDDRRTADRGIPSFDARPVATNASTFFGDPDASWAHVHARIATATLSHDPGARVSVRNRAQLASYDKFYQNVFPGAVNAAGDQVSISAYNNATRRTNLFNQTDLTLSARSGLVQHTLLLGTELGRQATDNLRHTGFFNNTTTSVTAPVAAPTISMPLTFRPSSTDADNHVTNTLASVYLQDQVELSEQLQLIAGVRYERFDIDYHNNRTDSTLARVDRMISPRAGLLFKPIPTMSLYASHSVSFLPSSGDQFSSLTDLTKALEPERFRNHEVGAKWDVADRLSITTAAYRLDRTNTRSPHPTDPTRTVQAGRQRTTGVELGVTGRVTSRWEVAGAYANQRARIIQTTSAAAAGAKVPLVPRTTVSLWNRYQLLPPVGVGIAVVHRAAMFAALDNKVTLPGHTEVDAALFLVLRDNLRAQANLENLFNVDYYATAHSNNNITPGSPRALRVSLTTSF